MEKSTTIINEKMQGVRDSNNSILNSISSPALTERNTAAEKLATGEFRIMNNYLDLLGLSNDADMIVLSPTNHYYYDHEDLEQIKTVLNLKLLNHIKDVREFLVTVNQMLPYKSHFIGGFIDKRTQTDPFFNRMAVRGAVDPVENGIFSRIPLLNMLYDFMDSRTNRSMTKNSVSLLLEDAGMKIVDITELNGLTCFCAQKITTPGN